MTEQELQHYPIKRYPKEDEACEWKEFKCLKNATGMKDAEAVAMLRKRKLIEGRLPHVYVSKDIAQATDQKVEYSKHKGLADKKCEALLLDSLNDHDSLTKQEIVRLLWDVLPDQLEDKQKMNKIEYLLKRLRKRGDVRNETKGNESVYSLGK